MTQAFNLSQLANNVNSSGQLDASTGLYNTGSIGFASGTVMIFAQTSAPTGWTKSTAHDNKALRIVSGTASSGGSVAFTTAFGTPAVSGSVSSTTLSTAQMPSHNHTFSNINACGGSYASAQALGSPGGTFSTNSTGGGGSHTHSLSGATTTINVAYVDVIIATKN
jgi:hypothetical protein